MSINVYLRGDEVRNLSGFTAEPRRDNNGNKWVDYNLPGIQLWLKSGRWFIMLSDPTNPIPAAVTDIVEEISFFGFIPMYPKREAGVYRHESAEAEIRSGMEQAKVHIRAKKMEDVLELFRKIKIGSIRPDESYEGPQGGKSRQELEAEFARALAEAENLRILVNESKRRMGRFVAMNDRLANGQFWFRRYPDGTSKFSWPFISKRRVVEELSQIICR